MSSIIFQDDSVDRVVFHYNKKHNEDSSIPMWVLKHKGQSFYVNHLNSKVGFSTKETSNNPSTKGSLLFRGRLKIYNENDEIIALIE